MDIQTRKLHFVHEFLRFKNEKLIDKLEKILKSERKKQFEDSLKPMNIKDFNKMIDNAEKDSKNGKLTSAQDLKKDIDSWI